MRCNLASSPGPNFSRKIFATTDAQRKVRNAKNEGLVSTAGVVVRMRQLFRIFIVKFYVKLEWRAQKYPRKHIFAVVQMIQCFLLLGLQLQVLPSNARKSIRYCLTERHSRRSALLNTKVCGKISRRILLTSAITQILGNGWRMCTTTPAVDTRPSFFAFHPFRHASVVANILRQKFGPGDEASCSHTNHKECN